MNTITFILDPLKAVFSVISGYVPTVLVVLVALVLGGFIAREAGKLIAAILKNMHVDKISHTVGIDHVLTTGGIKRSLSDLIAYVITWGITITALVIVLNYVGVPVIGPVTDPIIAYIPGVLTGVITLMVGMVIAHIASVFVRVVAANTDMPKPDMMATFTKYAVVLMALRVFIDKVGIGYLFSDTPLLLMTAALALALGLAFGLGGRDHAARYLDKLLK